MRIFVTGASGWIGSAVVPELIRAGHQVLGLARSDVAADAAARLGAEVLRGDLDDAGLLRAGAAGSDGVIHLAFMVPSVTEAATRADARAVETFAAALAGSGKPLVISGGTLVRPGRPATERDELIAAGPIAARIANLKAGLAAADRGVRSCLVMLPRSVHGEGDRHGFVPQLIARARARGVSGYIGAGAIETFAASLAGSGKPLVISGGTLARPGRPATERDELIAAGPVAARITNMQAALAAAARGVRSCLVMLPRSVHGEGERHGFIPQLIALARARGVSGYIGDGTSRWPAVHVQDAASLYRLAVEQAPAGAVLNAVGDEGVPVREIAEAIGRYLNLPATPLPAAEYQGMLVHLLSTDMPASSAITQELLGWKPTHPGLIEDIEQGHYFS